MVGDKGKWSPVQLAALLLLWFIAGCTAPPVPNVPGASMSEPTAQAVPEITRTLTETVRPAAAVTATLAVDNRKTPDAQDADALTRPIVSTRQMSVSAYRAINFCETPQSVTYENHLRVYCLHTETISFNQVVTALGEVMNDRFAMHDANGSFLLYDDRHRCEFNLCYAHVWYDKSNTRNAYALLRLYPLEVSGKQVAPLLQVKPNGDPQVLTDWQVVLVDQRTGEIVQILASPFVQMARNDLVAFNPSSGYFEVLDSSGASPRPTGKRLGLPLGEGQTTRLTAFVDDIALYNFDPADAAYMTDALAWLKENLPDWHDYFLKQRPLEIYRDGSLPFLSDGVCCLTRNADSTVGRIRFRDHFANWTGDAFPGASHDALARWSFLTTLIHEATHVRDLRLNRFDLNAVPSGLRDCVMHISTDEIEIQFSQQAAAIKISPSVLTQDEYAGTIQEFFQDVQNRAKPDKQKTCGQYYKPAFPGLMP